MKTWGLVLGTAALFAASTASAQTNLVVNGSFEDTTNFVRNTRDSNILSQGSTAMTGWTVVNQEVSWDGPNNPFSLSASNGSYFLDVTSDRDAAPFGGVEQAIQTMAGATYRLTFDLGSSAIYGFPVSLTATAGNASQTFSTTSTAPGNTTWEGQSMLFQASGASTTVRLIGAAGRNFIGLDNVSVVETAGAVPEPAAWAMMIVGFGAVGSSLRRRRVSVCFA